MGSKMYEGEAPRTALDISALDSRERGYPFLGKRERGVLKTFLFTFDVQFWAFYNINAISR